MLHYFAAIKNCEGGASGDCLTDIPQVDADPTTLSNFLSILFGVLAAVAVLIIVIQGVKYVLSQGDPGKATDARKGIIYAVVGLVVALSAEVVVRVVIGRL